MCLNYVSKSNEHYVSKKAVLACSQHRRMYCSWYTCFINLPNILFSRDILVDSTRRSTISRLFWEICPGNHFKPYIQLTVVFSPFRSTFKVIISAIYESMYIKEHFENRDSIYYYIIGVQVYEDLQELNIQKTS